jgi:DNA-binding NarL/FixJ family response regulator
MTIAERDNKILQLLSEGKTTKEIEAKVGRSDRTVQYRIDVLKAAYGAENIPHLIKIAMQKNIIK